MAPARIAGRVAALSLLLAISLLAPGCAFHRGDPLPSDPPFDFALEVRVRDAASWPWDGRVALDARGAVDYDVTFKDPPSTRRGRQTLEPSVRAEAWTAVVAAGFFDRIPVPEAEAFGPVVVEGRALGLDGRWSGDPATDAELAALLAALRRAAPARVFRPLPEPEKKK